MVLRDDVDVSRVNWANQARLTRRYAETLPHGWRRNAEIDRALACEAIAHSRDCCCMLLGAERFDCKFVFQVILQEILIGSE